MSDGLVVTPSTSPMDWHSLISFTSLVSAKNFMETSSTQDKLFRLGIQKRAGQPIDNL
jgi:hypothetical protein